MTTDLTNGRLRRHDGTLYLLLDVIVPDGHDDCDVATVALTPTLLDRLDAAMQLVAALATQTVTHGRLEHLAIHNTGDPVIICGAQYGEGDDCDLGVPIWDDPESEARLDGFTRCVSADAVWWEAIHHYSDARVETEWLHRADLPALRAALAQEEVQ